ncbi:hypothetical protein [Chelatococcus asaccharovorans]|uniref:hypothetical protein n=1 Tax=Chelatococcus asaccharovorans TaxID=28210 RepID=UPI00224C667F|nr:hypothetical protein [Chelatococcus asaccharovorans]CAH1674258.1 conserved hypothetical protein [Chelatococcus asaccharovorans]CAH1674359.1 conserved hypothetical protein [Chelatococcus asaccharovorans]
MRHVLTRQQLYDMVWERAVSKVAPELGISDVALRKQCVKHAIPLPDATYWGRLHAGRSVKRKPLCATPKGVSDRIVIDASAKPLAPEPIEEAIAAARQAAEAVAVPEKLHPLVAKTLAAARKAAPDRNGAITGLGGEVFRIRAHPDTLDRVGAFLNALVYNALTRGHRFEAGREGLEMVVADEAIGLAIYQTIRRSLHVATEEETRRRERWDARHSNDWDNWDKGPSIPYYDFTPTGEMAIEIAGWSRYENAQRRFADTRARKIDSRIDEILVSFAAFAAGRKVEREEARERARLEEIARQRRAEQARLAKLEQQRVEYLDRKLAQADERDRLRTFLATLPADHISEEASAFRAFTGWARQQLEKMDAQLQLAKIAAEVAGMEAFATDEAVNSAEK